jgi:hypothetical protein
LVGSSEIVLAGVHQARGDGATNWCRPHSHCDRIGLCLDARAVRMCGIREERTVTWPSNGGGIFSAIVSDAQTPPRLR